MCVLKNLYIAFDVTFNPTAGRFWSLNVDGTPIGNGFGAAYQFGTGWTTTNGLVWMPLDVRLTVTGLLTLNVTDTVGAGPVRTFAGILQGWLYPARFDAGLETT